MSDPTVSLDELCSTVLAGREDAGLLLGITWEDLLPEDRVVRLLLVPDPPKPGVRVIQAFLHTITRLELRHHGKTVTHLGPDDLDLATIRVELEGRTYAIGHRLSASWQYFSDTHSL